MPDPEIIDLSAMIPLLVLVAWAVLRR